MASTYDGVLAMHRMMGEGEPKLLRNSAANNGSASEAGLKEMMRDPSYWRDYQPGIVKRVKEGFQRLYPDKG